MQANFGPAYKVQVGQPITAVSISDVARLLLQSDGTRLVLPFYTPAVVMLMLMLASPPRA